MEHSLPKPAINHFLLIWKVNINYFETKAEKPLHALTMSEKFSAFGVKKMLKWARNRVLMTGETHLMKLDLQEGSLQEKGWFYRLCILGTTCPPYHSLSLEKRVTNSPYRKSYLKKLWVFLDPRVGTLLIFPIHGWWSLVSFESHQISYSSLWKVATATFQWQDSQIPPLSNQGALWLHQSASVLTLFPEKVLEPTVILDGLPLCRVRPKLLPSRKETEIGGLQGESSILGIFQGSPAGTSFYRRRTLENVTHLLKACIVQRTSKPSPFPPPKTGSLHLLHPWLYSGVTFPHCSVGR